MTCEGQRVEGDLALLVGRHDHDARAALGLDLAGNAAGFAAGADAETLRNVARTVYLAPLPAAALGLWAMSRFVRAPAPDGAPDGSRG